MKYCEIFQVNVSCYVSTDSIQKCESKAEILKEKGSTGNLNAKLGFVKHNTIILKKMKKSFRSQSAKPLSVLIENCLQVPSKLGNYTYIGV